MSRRKNKRNGLYEYLDACGVLETGTDEVIAAARRQYRREYKANWRKQKRKTEKQFTISFSAEQFKCVAQAAQQHHRSNTRYIQEATLAYSRQQFLVPDLRALGNIRELLAQNYNALQSFVEEGRVHQNIGDMLLNNMEQLEAKVLGILTNPETLETAIKAAIRNSPAYREVLLQYCK